VSIPLFSFRVLAPVSLWLGAFGGFAFAQQNLPNGANESGVIASHSQTDLWTFTASKGDYLAIGMSETGTNTSFLPYVRLIGPDGVLYAQDSGNLQAQVHLNAPLTGIYTVQASREDSTNSGGSYSITLAKAPGTFAVPSGDDGGSMTDGQNYSGTLLRADLDQWSFTANKGDYVAVGMSEVGTNTSFLPYVRLIGPDGVLYAQDSGDLDAQVHLNAPLSGTYTVLVSRADQTDGVGYYSLTMAESSEAIVVPPGDQGGAMVNGQNYSGTLLRADLDQWSFTASKGDYLAVGMSEMGTNTSFLPYLRLIGPDGVVYAQDSGDLQGRVQLNAPLTGKYTALASRADQTDGIGNYSITLARAPARFVVSSGDEGGEMTDGRNYPGTLLRGDLDQWSFTATKGDYLAVGMSEMGTNTSFLPYLRLIGPDGVVYAQDSGDLDAQVHLNAPLSGTYTVFVSRADQTDGIGYYSLTMARAPGRIVVPPGDQGGAISNGQNYSGTLLRADLDEWSFYSSRNSAITVSVSETGTNTSFLPYVRLIGPDGVLYAQDSGDLDAQVHITAPLSGTYTVLVSRADQTDGVGYYSLSVLGANSQVPLFSGKTR
jgi:trimeric autotransporter adhesin